MDTNQKSAEIAIVVPVFNEQENVVPLAQEIRDALSATYGPIPLEAVVEYLRALESIGVIRI